MVIAERPFRWVLVLLLAFSSQGTQAAAGGGTRPESVLSVPLHPANYTFYTGHLRPDSAVARFHMPVKPEGYEGYLTVPGVNRSLLDRQLSEKNLAFFRCFYRDANLQVYKYQDVLPSGRVLAEGILSGTNGRSVEIQQFYPSGSVLSRSQYLLPVVDSQSRAGYQVWYGFHPVLLRHGTEDVYYENEQLRMEKIYDLGKLRDTTYTQFYPDGKMRLVYSVRDGQLDGRYRSFGPEGEVLRDAGYLKGKLIREDLASRTETAGRKAFLFGIDKYARPPGTIPGKAAVAYPDYSDLDGCRNDVLLLKDVLVHQKDFGEAGIVTILDEEATRENVLAAFRRFLGTIQKGDIVFIHFSGHGHYVRDAVNGGGELYIPCHDVNKYPGDRMDKGGIRQEELEDFLAATRSAAGPRGQLYLSIDVSFAGLLLPADDPAATRMAAPAFRGQPSELLIGLLAQEGAPLVVFTGTTREFGFETKDEDGTSYGAYSLALGRALSDPGVLVTSELHERLLAFMEERGIAQIPGYFSEQPRFLFESDAFPEPAGSALAGFRPKGNCFVLSIGISDYPVSAEDNFRFSNSAADAAAYAEFFSGQFRKATHPGDTLQLHSVLLQNEQAGREQILAAINEVIAGSRPEDYFVFNFSGYCKQLPDSSGGMITYFIPHGLKDLDDTAAIRENGLSLKQFKDLLQLIPADRQLFITEAGSTAGFQREFIHSLIETSPTIAAISNKNRIFIVPKSVGLDRFSCGGQPIEHGPLNYYITRLSSELNIFGLFEGPPYADAVEYALTKAEVDCAYFGAGYFDIFFEEEFLGDLEYFLSGEPVQSRSIGVLRRREQTHDMPVTNRYALVIGTDRYEGKPDWNDLNNPVYDAAEIAALLQKDFGYRVSMLKNEPADSIYQEILDLSTLLDPSDQLLIFVAGHGDFDEALFDDGFIVCHDSKPLTLDPYRNSYIQYSKLSRMINKLPARQILMVLDVCFGGTFDERVARNQSRSRTGVYRDMSSLAFFSEKMKKTTRLYLTSGGKREVPDGYKGQHSPFALRLLEALRTKGGEAGLLTATDLYQFVKMLPSGPLLGSFGDDEAGSEFVLLAN